MFARVFFCVATLCARSRHPQWRTETHGASTPPPSTDCCHCCCCWLGKQPPSFNLHIGNSRKGQPWHHLKHLMTGQGPLRARNGCGRSVIWINTIVSWKWELSRICRWGGRQECRPCRWRHSGSTWVWLGHLLHSRTEDDAQQENSFKHTHTHC